MLLFIFIAAPIKTTLINKDVTKKLPVDFFEGLQMAFRDYKWFQGDAPLRKSKRDCLVGQDCSVGLDMNRGQSINNLSFHYVGLFWTHDILYIACLLLFFKGVFGGVFPSLNRGSEDGGCHMLYRLQGPLREICDFQYWANKIDLTWQAWALWGGDVTTLEGCHRARETGLGGRLEGPWERDRCRSGLLRNRKDQQVLHIKRQNTLMPSRVTQKCSLICSHNIRVAMIISAIQNCYNSLLEKKKSIWWSG